MVRRFTSDSSCIYYEPGDNFLEDCLIQIFTITSFILMNALAALFLFKLLENSQEFTFECSVLYHFFLVR